MKYSIILKEFAQESIRNIADYIYCESFSEDAAQNVYDRLYAGILSLSIFPERFSNYNNMYRVMTLERKI